MKQGLGLIECVPVELALHGPDAPVTWMELQRTTWMYNSRLMALPADLNAPRSGAEPMFVGVDMQRIHSDFAPDDPDPRLCFRLTLRLGPIDCVLYAIPLGGYDGAPPLVAPFPQRRCPVAR